MRAVIYARYSSDNQSEKSIEDQIRICRAEIDRRGWQFSTAYSDRAISGASTLRTDYQKLMADAREHAFDVVVAEGLDRLSRDQADTATLYKHLSYLGVSIVTIAEGEISELHVGLKGTMNALFLKDLAIKTRRGLEGRVRQGLSGGGLCYGYDLVIGQTGVRRINENQARVVRRIFEEYAAGRSPRAIARTLNSEGLVGPLGRQWRDTAIRGHLVRGTGILNNELYVGRLVWNRMNYTKHPTDGRRRSRLNAPERWITENVPALRIVDEPLWQAVKKRQQAIRTSDGTVKARATRFWERRRSRHLLSGLVACQECGGPYASIGRNYLACSAARGRGTCSNRPSIRRDALESIILDGLRSRLMAPSLVEEFVAAFHEEVNRQHRDRRTAHNASIHELEEVTRKLHGLIDAIAEGLRAPGIQTRLEELEARKSALERALEGPPELPFQLDPNLSEVYRQKVEQLQISLDKPGTREEAATVLRGLLEQIVIGPVKDGFEIEITGEIARMIEIGLPNGKKRATLDERMARSVKVVAGVGFEPTTFRL
jgi:DNA invertase Pin-like site-specific DNA recombinase